MATDRDKYAAWVRAPDLPTQPTQPTKSYFICGTPRSGTWLLSSLLASTGRAGRLHEYFWRDTQRSNEQLWRIGPGAYVARVRDAATTLNGVLGSSIKREYLTEFLALLRAPQQGPATDLELISRSFPDPHFVFVWREDVVAQAVSWAIAIQSGYWHHWDTPSRDEPRFDLRQVDALVRELTQHHESWRSWFAENGVQPLELTFERLVRDKERATRCVLAFLGVEAAGGSIVEQTARTGSALNAEWVRLYRDRVASTGNP